MKYFYIEPEVAGGLGSQTVIDTSKSPPLVTKLHYTFEGWLGDEILETFPCYIITKSLANDIEATRLRGVLFADVIVDVSATFTELYPERRLPTLVWMKVEGHEGDDFFVAPDGRLVVSEPALELIGPRAPNCMVTRFEG